MALLMPNGLAPRKTEALNGDWSLNVPPFQSAPNYADPAFGHAVISGYFAKQAAIGPDGDNIGLGEFGNSVGRSIPISVSSFSASICGILGISAKKKMARIYAARVVAAVQCASAVVSGSHWNSAVRQFPCNAVRAITFSINGEPAVSSAINTCSPEPARIGLLNLSPETNDDRLLLSHTTSLGSVVRGAARVTALSALR